MQKDIHIGELPAYHTYPDTPEKHPGLIIIHEIWGLNEHTKDVANRFAAQGYSVIAPDLFHALSFEGIDHTILDEMKDPEKRDEAQKKMRAILAPIQAPEYAVAAVADLKSCVDNLLADEGVNGAVGVLGFCFGGSYAFHLAANDPRIRATVPFYGQPPSEEEIATIISPVLAFYGDQDAALMESLPKLTEDMRAAGKSFEAVVYPGIGHAFFNDTNARMYGPHAASDAWEKSLAFLRTNLT